MSESNQQPLAELDRLVSGAHQLSNLLESCYEGTKSISPQPTGIGLRVIALLSRGRKSDEFPIRSAVKNWANQIREVAIAANAGSDVEEGVRNLEKLAEDVALRVSRLFDANETFRHLLTNGIKSSPDLVRFLSHTPGVIEEIAVAEVAGGHKFPEELIPDHMKFLGSSHHYDALIMHELCNGPLVEAVWQLSARTAASQQLFGWIRHQIEFNLRTELSATLTLAEMYRLRPFKDGFPFYSFGDYSSVGRPKEVLKKVWGIRTIHDAVDLAHEIIEDALVHQMKKDAAFRERFVGALQAGVKNQL